MHSPYHGHRPQGLPICGACAVALTASLSFGTTYQLVDIGVFPGEFGTAAVDINDSGQVLANSESSPSSFAVRYTPGVGLVKLDEGGTNNSRGVALNNAGQVAGYQRGMGTLGAPYYWRYTDGIGYQLNTAPAAATGGVASENVSMNELGTIVGSYEITSESAPSTLVCIRSTPANTWEEMYTYDPAFSGGFGSIVRSDQR